MDRNRTWTLQSRKFGGTTYAPEIIEKQPSEKLRLEMDFNEWIFQPEILSNLVVSADSELVISGETIDGYLISFFMEGVLTPRRYTVACLVECNSREILQGVGILKVSGR